MPYMMSRQCRGVYIAVPCSHRRCRHSLHLVRCHAHFHCAIKVKATAMQCRCVTILSPEFVFRFLTCCGGMCLVCVRPCCQVGKTYWASANHHCVKGETTNFPTPAPPTAICNALQFLHFMHVTWRKSSRHRSRAATIH